LVNEPSEDLIAENRLLLLTTILIGTVFLPLVVEDTLVEVRVISDTEVGFPDAILAENPELAGTTLTVPPDALFSDDGTRGGMVGIASVDPERLPGELPEGLEFPIVITVQTDGATNFDQPVPVCFPNLPDPVTGTRMTYLDNNNSVDVGYDGLRRPVQPGAFLSIPQKSDRKASV
jgi:hypothetical protein